MTLQQILEKHSRSFNHYCDTGLITPEIEADLTTYALDNNKPTSFVESVLETFKISRRFALDYGF